MITQRQKLKKQINLLEYEIILAKTRQDYVHQVELQNELDRLCSTLYNLD